MAKAFNLMLTEAERGLLEAHRVRLGLRSQAEVIRHFIGSDWESVVVSPGAEAKILTAPKSEREAAAEVTAPRRIRGYDPITRKPYYD